MGVWVAVDSDVLKTRAQPRDRSKIRGKRHAPQKAIAPAITGFRAVETLASPPPGAASRFHW